MNDFASMRVWSEEDATSINPIRLDDIDEEQLYYNERVESAEVGVPNLPKASAQKKKRRRRRKKFSEEESSVADSVLSSILSDDDDDETEEYHKSPIAKVSPAPLKTKSMTDAERRRERVEEIKARRKKKTEERMQQYPSSDEEAVAPNEVKKNPFSKKAAMPLPISSRKKNAASKKSKPLVVIAPQDDDLSQNPFSDKNEGVVESDDDLSKNPFSNKNQTVVDDDDLSKNPFSDKNTTMKLSTADDDLSQNPFSDNVRKSKKKSSGNNPFDDEDEEVRTSEDDMMTVPSAATGESEEESDEEDIIESSRRLLRCVDQRIQYQQQNDEVASLKKQVKQMKLQAEAMAEQLRRAVATKCDLVLAQNEMERRHEQELIGKDGEMRDLRKYIQDILEEQAKSELNFMNEIASLARTLDTDKAKHKEEVNDKDRRIIQLENRIETMRVASLRGHSSPNSPNSFHRFNDPAKELLVQPSYE